MRKKLLSTEMMMRIALLSAISFILFRFMEIPVIGFYKIDLSGIPVLLAGFAMGPLAGIITLFIKDLLGIIGSSSGGIGEIADFFMLASLILPVTIIYHYKRTRATVLWGLMIGTILMIVSGMLLNYYLLIPLYTKFMSVEEIVAIMDKAIPFLKIDTLKELIFFVTGPFNLLKGFVLSVLTYLIYPYVSPILKKGRI